MRTFLGGSEARPARRAMNCLTAAMTYSRKSNTCTRDSNVGTIGENSDLYPVGTRAGEDPRDLHVELLIVKPMQPHNITFREWQIGL